MKKRIFLLLLSTLLLLLVACGGEEVEEPVVEIEEQPAVPATLPAEATLPPPVVEEEVELPDDAAEPQDQAQGADVEGEEPPAEEVVVEPEPTAPVPLFPWPEDRFGYGIQVHGNATVGDTAGAMNAVANQLGMDWVKVQVRWSDVHLLAEMYEQHPVDLQARLRRSGVAVADPDQRRA